MEGRGKSVSESLDEDRKERRIVTRGKQSQWKGKGQSRVMT
jgi:hypothetical protein